MRLPALPCELRMEAYSEHKHSVRFLHHHAHHLIVSTAMTQVNRLTVLRS